MREATEAADDAGVLLGIFQEFVRAGAARELDAVLLVGELLRMHERQIEELPRIMRHLLVEPAREGARRNSTRQGIVLVGAGVAAEHVARELVEYDDERERPLRRLLPCRQRARDGGVPDREEPYRDLGIERRILLEPFVRPGGAPECEHVLRPDRLGAAALVRAHSRIRPAVMSS